MTAIDGKARKVTGATGVIETALVAELDSRGSLSSLYAGGMLISLTLTPP